MNVTRSYIDEISIQNFKFFQKLDKPIKIDGKHLLLYGENGSGKSSIYWALYTLLECANKDDEEQIKKYFRPTEDEDERLTNIHIMPNTNNWVNPYIQVTLKDGTAPYIVSFENTSINSNKEAQESNLSSDFISYRNLLSLYNFAHSEDIDLFHFFKYAVLPYVKFTPVTYWHKKRDKSIIQLTTNSANRIWDFVVNGPQKNIQNRQGFKRYPIGLEQELNDYRNIVSGFKSGLRDLITYINTEGNPILKDELGYNLTFKLELEEKIFYKGKKKRRDPFLVTEQNFEPPAYRIWFKITEYEGIPNAVKRAQSFLNEARLTAVGLAIRLAVLKRSLSEDAKLKVLVLDDLLISLDMSNREKVVDLILKKYIKDYQVFILTHDRVMFDDTLRHIDLFHRAEAKKSGITDEATLNQITNDKWCILEMYQALDKNNVPRPFITDSLNSISKALYYFKEQVDYNACGNNLRTALEEFFRDFLDHRFLRDENGHLVDNKRLMLDNLLTRAKKYFEYVGYDTSLLDKIDRYIKRSLNPSSHYNPKANYYRKELQDIFDIYYSLKRLKNQPLIKVNDSIKFSIVTQAGNSYTYKAEILDDILFYNKNDNTGNFLLTTDKREYIITECTKNKTEKKETSNITKKYTLQELFNETVDGLKTHLHEDPIIEQNMNQVFKNVDDITFEELLKRLI